MSRLQLNCVSHTISADLRRSLNACQPRALAVRHPVEYSAVVESQTSGILYLIPTPIAAEASTDPDDAIRSVVSTLDGVIGESRKMASAFLKKMKGPHLSESAALRLLNEHTRPSEIEHLIEPIERGESWGLISDAGCPAVADPGAALVRLAHARGVRVKPLAGPSAVLLSLMGSGLNGQRFVFHGYLSRDAAERRRELKNMESDSRRFSRSHIWIETPYRNSDVFAAALACLNEKTLFCVASDLTAPSEEIRTNSMAAWRACPPPDLRDRPTVFLLESS